MNADGHAGGLRAAGRLRAALRPLDAPPATACWNHDELEGLLESAVDLADAAVLVGLVAREAGDAVLLTRRTAGLRNHGGQVSFRYARPPVQHAQQPLAVISSLQTHFSRARELERVVHQVAHQPAQGLRARLK